MSKVWTVAGREYRATIKTKAFLVALILMPVFMGGGITIQVLTEGKLDTDTKKLGVVDRSGKMFAALAEAVEKRNTDDIIDKKTHKPTEPLYALENIPPQPDADKQFLALSERVNKHELFAFIEVGEKVLEGGDDSDATMIRYFSDQPTYDDIRRWLMRKASERVQSVRLKEAGLDRAVVDRAMHPVYVKSLGLYTKNEGGKIKQAEETNFGMAFGLPFGMVMMMFMTLMMTTQPMLQGILEEKMQRISEVLLGSVRPFELMLGKLFGYVGVATTLVGFYMAGGIIVAKYYNKIDIVPMHLIGWFILFQSLAIFMYGAMFLACGACCSDTREAQNLVLPLMIPMMIPMFVLGTVLQHPHSTFATVLSIFPLSAPMLMIMRMSIPPAVPLWQPSVAIVGTLLTTIFCVWAAGRVFRLGLLLQGKPPKLSELAKWVIKG